MAAATAEEPWGFGLLDPNWQLDEGGPEERLDDIQGKFSFHHSHSTWRS